LGFGGPVKATAEDVRGFTAPTQTAPLPEEEAGRLEELLSGLGANQFKAEREAI